MSTELQPRTRHRDVVGGTFALGFDKKRHICQVFSIPWSKRSKFLESVAVIFPEGEICEFGEPGEIETFLL